MTPQSPYACGHVTDENGIRVTAGRWHRLCERVAEIASSFHIPTLYLQTEHLNNGGLYARLGWTPIDRVHYQGVEVLVMERRLGVRVEIDPSH